MRRIFIVSVLILALSPAFSFAQTGSGMMEGQRGGMMEHGRMMRHEDMMEHGRMMNDMMRMTNQMSDMMGRLSDVMQSMRYRSMIKASELLRDMSRQMMEMSRMMKRGEVSHEEMARLHERMREMQENPLMAYAGHWEAPEAAARRHNPVPATWASVVRGRRLYRQYCVSCHGESARGNGPAGAGLTPGPSNLRKSAEDHTAGELAWKIANGRGPMPAWKNTLSESQIWDLVNFIKSLKRDHRYRRERP